MTKIALIGPGAIGGTVAAWLAQVAEHDLVICARTSFSELLVETPHGTLTVHPRVVTSPSQTGPVDWILVATKTYDSAPSASWLKSLLGPDTRLAVLQNGVEHVANFSSFVSTDRILPVIVDCPAERTAPGKIHQRRRAWMKVPDNQLGQSFQSLFAGTPIEVQLSPNFLAAAWSKLCINCAGAVSALTLKPSGLVRNSPEIAELLRGLVRECIAVANAEGAKLPDTLVETVIEGYRNAPPDSINSLHADRLAGRPMEIDARNGIIVRMGVKHGISTPLNQAMVALLLAVQGQS